MNENDREKQEEAIFEQAAQIASEVERAAYLAKACGGDPELRARLDVLLEGHFKGQGFLEGESGQAAGSAGTVRVSPTEEEELGTFIGRYKLLEKVGEGGFGAVYVAEQREPVKRRVALKIIKLGMDTRQVIARFEAERQALALMDHPNIARVLDASATETGRPYFVMELVRGIRITDYCDQNNLPTQHRLDLFMQVCHAIQHAHQKGIIHRDIKPSNILVTVVDGRPVPKVIDFGIAKATQGQLTDKTVYTQLNQFIGTPAYMSPEQAQLSGVDVDTRSDIYSLGVLLYELLTGHTPFDLKTLAAAGLDEMRRIIREQEPPRPSTRISTLDAAERTTVAKHRQAEPGGLSRSVRGDLDWIVMKCLEKERARRYETANNVALDIEHHLNHEPVTAAAPNRAYRAHKFIRRHKVGLAMAAVIVLLLAAGVVASTWQAVRATRAEREQTRLRQIAETKEKKSEQTAQFLKDMLKGVGPPVASGRDTTILREILGQTAERLGNDLKGQPEVEAELRNTIGGVYSQIGEFEKAGVMHRRALAIHRQLFGNEHLNVATSLHNLGFALSSQRKLPEAETVCREALAIRRKLLGSQHSEVGRSLNELGFVLSAAGRRAEAEALFRQALAIFQNAPGNEERDLTGTLNNLGYVLTAQGKLDEGGRMYREALTRRRHLYGDENLDVARVLNDLAYALRVQGKLEEAETMQREALATRRKLLGNDHPSVATCLNQLGLVFRDEGKLKEAEAAVREALRIRRKQLGNDHPSVNASVQSLVSVLRAQGKTNEAQVLIQGGQDSILAQQTHALLAAGKFAEAEPVARQCLELREKEIPNDWRTFNTRSLLGGSLLGQRKYAEAEPLLLSGYEGMKQREESIPAAGRVHLRTAPRRLAQLYESTGRPEKAAEARAEVTPWYRKEVEGLRIAAPSGGAQALNALGWVLATCDDPAIRDGPGAIGYAEQAVAATARTNAAYLDTLAAACAEAGQFARAVTIQKEAMALLRDEESRKDCASRLTLYESNKPYRVSE